jgi:integral membrane sensor domain MASE1
MISVVGSTAVLTVKVMVITCCNGSTMGVKKLQQESKYPWSNYTLRIGGGRPVSATQYTLYIVQIAVVIVLSYLSVVMLGPLSYSGISLFYFVYPFIIVFTLWWGVWGMLGGYIGCVIGAGLMVGVGVVPSILYAISDLVPFIVMFAVYRGVLAKRGIDPLMRDLTDKEVRGTKTHRGLAWLWFIIINALVLNAISAELGIGIEYALGLVPAGAFWFWWAGWFAGDGLAMIIITPILVKGLTSLVERQGLVNYGWVT